MKSDDEDDIQRPKLAAATLRQSIAENEAAKVDEALKKRTEADRELQRLFRESLEEQITQQELDDIRQKILRATEQSELEVLVLQFPAKLCTDNGRAINNGESDWPATLQGKDGTPGTVLDDRLTIACGTGAIRPALIQRAGKPAMSLDDFLRGNALPAGTMLA